MGVTYLRLIIFSVVADILIDSEIFLMTYFINLKIKSVQSFEGVHKDRMCVRVFIRKILIHIQVFMSVLYF
jgi:hypothetical protein